MSDALVLCPICGGPDALGAGVCPGCGGAPDGGSLVFVRRQQSGRDREAVGVRLGDLLGDRLDTPDGRAAILGDLALYRVPPSLAVRIVSGLEERGVPARAVPPERAWSVMPAHFFAMLVAILLAGGAAGLTAAPAYLWLSPMLAGVLLLIAHRSMNRTLVSATGNATLGADAESALVDALAALPDGRVRALLGDVGRIARPLALAVRRDGDPGGLATCISDFVMAAAATALEVDRLQETVNVLEHDQGISAHGHTTEEMQAIAGRCRDAADIGTGQLVDAVKTLSQIGDAAGLDARAGVRLAEVTRDLVAAAGIRERAIQDVAQLLDRS